MFFRDCIMELLGVVCTIMHTIKGLSKDFNTGTSQICISKELEWLLLLRGNTSSGGVSVLACSFRSCSPSHSCSALPPSLPLCSWSAGLFFVFRRRASAVGFSLGANRCYRSFKTDSFPVLAYFTRRTRQRSTESSCVCKYLWDIKVRKLVFKKQSVGFLNTKLKLIMGQTWNVPFWYPHQIKFTIGINCVPNDALNTTHLCTHLCSSVWIIQGYFVLSNQILIAHPPPLLCN